MGKKDFIQNLRSGYLAIGITTKRKGIKMNRVAQTSELSVIEDGFGLTRPGGLVPPIFNMVTLRDGNQAMENPWDSAAKNEVFDYEVLLGAQAIEVGYPAASKKDFDSVVQLCRRAPKGIIIGALARANESDIQRAGDALEHCQRAIPRLHTFLGMSPFHMEQAISKSPNEILAMAIDAVQFARQLVGENGQIEFSPEHFGDSLTNFPWLVDALVKIAHAGQVDVINLPNTVERYRPEVFGYMVRRVVEAMPEWVTVSVHCHDDLDMVTATTMAGYFAGATQIECCTHRLGERSGNCPIHTVAVVLHNNGVPVDLNMSRIYETTLEVAKLAEIPIHPKEPLIGVDVRKTRSGVHQHGSTRTRQLPKGAYRPIDWRLIGRTPDDEIEFTSQSGHHGARAIILEGGRTITVEETKLIMPALTSAADKYGKLSAEELVAVYDAFQDLRKRMGIVQPEDIKPKALAVLQGIREDDAWKLVSASHFSTPDGRCLGYAILSQNGDEFRGSADGGGPVDAVFNALYKITQADVVLSFFDIEPIREGQQSPGVVSLTLSMDDQCQDAERSNPDIVSASAEAYVTALNTLLRKNKP